ncbi:MAG: hypothetical protein HOJ50_07180, partial [Proteobacteria bacterium]|nr:hypothetical protein [Pseudomonadota bacterium]
MAQRQINAIAIVFPCNVLSTNHNPGLFSQKITDARAKSRINSAPGIARLSDEQVRAMVWDLINTSESESVPADPIVMELTVITNRFR